MWDRGTLWLTVKAVPHKFSYLLTDIDRSGWSCCCCLVMMWWWVCCQRSAGYERQIEQLHQQLSDVLQSTTGTTERGAQDSSPDMQQAIDILKRSSLEVELAAKEAEVRHYLCCITSTSVVDNLSLVWSYVRGWCRVLTMGGWRA